MTALAADVFGELGVKSTSMAKVADGAGIVVERLTRIFPGGKDEIIAEAIECIDAWFVDEIVLQLEKGEPREAVARMWGIVELYVRIGGRRGVLLAFSPEKKGRFAKQKRAHFRRWVSALNATLIRAGIDDEVAWHLALDVVTGIQRGPLVGKALRDESILARTLVRYRARLEVALRNVSPVAHQARSQV
jgi:TetR/AcrR family transcriptional repressor of lmrAB and yxaGH operons